jgi:heme ABC exporter ATP-binding subunit CcmA
MSMALSSPLMADVGPSATARPLVVVSQLEKTFEIRPVLRKVSFALPAGETLALLGPNGAGKTTLLRVLATLVRPTAGEVWVAGLEATRDAHEIRRMIGYVGHQPGVYEDLTVRENLRFFARMYGLREGRALADELVERVGLRAKANERVRALSRGQTQRLALARGVMHDPTLLLLDEPDTGLDEEAGALLTALLRERAAAGKTTIFTTHQLARGLSLAGRALVLVGGRVVHDGLTQATSADQVRGLYRRETGRPV